MFFTCLNSFRSHESMRQRNDSPISHVRKSRLRAHAWEGPSLRPWASGQSWASSRPLCPVAVRSNPRAASEDTCEFASAQGSFLGETLPPRLHLSFPSEALPFSPRCWEDSVYSSLEVLEALGGETHYKYPAFIISLPGGTVLHVGEATPAGAESQNAGPRGLWGAGFLVLPGLERICGGMKPLRGEQRGRGPLALQ